MTNVGEFLSNIVETCGLDASDEKYKDLFSKTSSIEIPEDVPKTFNESLLTKEAAKNNPEISAHFKATILKGLDSRIEKVMDELKVPNEVKEAITGEANSFEKAALLASKLNELKKSDTPEPDKKGDEEKAKLIEELNAQIAELKEGTIPKDEHQKSLSDYNRKLEKLLLTNKLSGRKVVEHAKDEDYLLARTKISKALGEMGAVARLNEETGDFDVKTTEGDDFFLNNKKVSYDTIVDKVLSDHKLIEVNSNGHANQGVTTPDNGSQTVTTKTSKALQEATEMAENAKQYL